jgi:hypothetical protein
VARDWLERHPQWIVGLVRSDLVRFGQGDFHTVSHRPLTAREARFATGGWPEPGTDPKSATGRTGNAVA